MVCQLLLLNIWTFFFFCHHTNYLWNWDQGDSKTLIVFVALKPLFYLPGHCPFGRHDILWKPKLYLPSWCLKMLLYFFHMMLFHHDGIHFVRATNLSCSNPPQQHDAPSTTRPKIHPKVKNNPSEAYKGMTSIWLSQFNGTTISVFVNLWISRKQQQSFKCWRLVNRN